MVRLLDQCNILIKLQMMKILLWPRPETIIRSKGHCLECLSGRGFLKMVVSLQ